MCFRFAGCVKRRFASWWCNEEKISLEFSHKMESGFFGLLGCELLGVGCGLWVDGCREERSGAGL